MADPVASIVTLSQLTLSLLRATIEFFRRARIADKLVQKVVEKLTELEVLVVTVEKTCQQADRRPSFSIPGPGDADPWSLLRASLAKCHELLDRLNKKVRSFGSRESLTTLQKVILQWKSDQGKSEIENTIRDVSDLISRMSSGMMCANIQVSLEIQNQIAYNSQLSTVQQESSFPQNASQAHRLLEAQDPLEDQISPLLPTLTWRSDADTVCSESRSCRGASISISNDSSIFSTLWLAIKNGDPKRVRAALAEGDLIMCRWMKNNWTALHYAAHNCAGEEARLQVMRELLEPDVKCMEPGDINTKDSSGRTPLHIAAKMGDVKLGELLLQHNADKNAIDSHHHSVLDLAIESNHEKFVELLLCKSVDYDNVSEEYQQRFGELKDTIAFRKMTAARTRSTKSNTKAVKKQTIMLKTRKVPVQKKYLPSVFANKRSTPASPS